MLKFKLTLEYDGSKFSGWQRQGSGRIRTVQEEIERAIAQVFHEPVDVVGAGRTDAGVHARGQVAHVAFHESIPDRAEIFRALAGVLPRDIVCREVVPVHETFHARYGAIRRTYSYLVTRRPRAIGRNYAWFVGGPLDGEAMNRAAAHVVGTHDFSAYSKENREVTNRCCTVVESRWITGDDEWRYVISADRFVYSMIRALTGAMIGVGRGRISSEEFIAIHQSGDRLRNRNALAPPHGLCLESVDYP